MKKIILLILTLLFALSCPAFGWNANGHVLMSQLAYEQLTLNARKKVDQLSEILFKQLPFATQYQLSNKYPNVSISKFAQLSVLPDQFRNQPLISVFEQYQAQLPKTLKHLSQENTQTWHFTNQTYPNPNCKKSQQYDLLWSISTLERIIKSEKNLISQGLELIMLTHFIEDAHQPLHTFSYANKACKIDKGGNLFCLTESNNKTSSKIYCKKHNLHHLWDTGLGFLKGKQTNFSRKLALVREKLSTHNLKTTQAISMAQWLKESYSLAEFIYSIEPYEKPEASYYRKGQEIAKEQMAIASTRLAQILNRLFDDRTNELSI